MRKRIFHHRRPGADTPRGPTTGCPHCKTDPDGPGDTLDCDWCGSPCCEHQIEVADSEAVICGSCAARESQRKPTLRIVRDE